MDRLNVFLIRLRLLLLVSPEALDLLFVLVLSDAEVADFGIQILDLRGLPRYSVTLLLQLSLQRFLFLSEATLETDYFFFKVLDLASVDFFAFIVLHLLSFDLAELLLHFFAFAD